MNIKKGTPGKGGGPRPDSFSYTPVAHGTKNAFNAWMAGEPYWADEAHEHTKADPGTKPCVDWLTDSAVKCRRCRQGRPVKCIGWVPLYREQDGKPIIVIVHEHVADLLKGIVHPMYVLVGRVDDKSSVFVKKSESNIVMRTDKDCRKRRIDVVPDLLTMWGLTELNEWLRGQRHHQAAEEEPPPVLKQRLSVPPPTTRIEALAVDAEKKADGPYLLNPDDFINDTLKRSARAEKNGHHHTNGEDQS